MSADEMMAHRRLGESLERARRAIESLGVRSPNVPAPAIPEGAPAGCDCGGEQPCAYCEEPIVIPEGAPPAANDLTKACPSCAAPAWRPCAPDCPTRRPSVTGSEPTRYDLTDRAHIERLESEVARLTRSLAAYREVVEAAMRVVASPLNADTMRSLITALASLPTTEGTKDG
jgi:hypothetical protein